jgi:hypothetical protein
VEFLLYIIVEFLGQMILELLLGAFVEFIIEIGFRSAFKDRNYASNSVLVLTSLFAYMIVAGAFAFASVLVFEFHFIRSHEARVWNLLITPIVLGLLMGFYGRYLMKSGKSIIRLDTFAYGFFFAFIFALVRFVFAK